MANWTIREAVPEDAQPMIHYVKALFNEPNLDIPAGPGEFRLSLEEERAVIARHHESPNSVFLLAVDADGEILGMLNCAGSTRRALRHSCELGLSVALGHRDLGVGKDLLTAMVAWARGTGLVTRIELKVYARNERAIHLYRKFGFEEEGRRRRAVFQEGQYLDDLVMALLL